jgi:hypothetical protein
MSVREQARLYGLLAAVLIVCMAMYWQHAGNYFFFDSQYALQHNQWLAIDGSELEDWRVAALSTAAGPLGRPISNLSFAINAVLDGEISALSIKRTNALIHCLIGLCLMFLLRLLFTRSPLLNWTPQRATAVAVLASACWLLHPLQVSTVMYAVQRMTQLPALFVVLGLYSFFRLRVQWLHRSPSAEDISQAIFLLFTFTALAALSKENGLLLPWLAGITELCLFRFHINGEQSRRYQHMTMALLVLPIIALLMVVLVDASLLERSYELRDFSLAERVLTQLRVLWIYLSWLSFPVPGTFGFFHDDISWSQSIFETAVLLAITGWLALLVLCWKLRNSVPLLAFAVLWYLVAHSMESSVLPLEMVFEHRNYLPAVGFVVLLAGLCEALSRYLKVQFWLLGGGVLILSALLLFVRTSYWQNELGLAERDFTFHPESQRARIHLASAYQDAALAATDPELIQRYLIAARELAYRSYLAQPESIQALVLLIHFDGNSTNIERVDNWLDKLQQAVFTGRLSVADINFLEFYNSCVLERDCLAPDQGQQQFLQKLARHNAQQPQVWLMLIDYCLKTGDVECVTREAEALVAVHPDFREALEYIYHAAVVNGDAGNALLTLQRILARDSKRRLAGRMRASETAL